MRYGPAHKEETRARLFKAAGRRFRRDGFGGVGVDALAKDAQVTSGAFYGHFPSKEAAFEAVVVAGLRGLRDAIVERRQVYGDRWIEVFIDLYTSERRTCDLGESCALQSLTPEVQRAGEPIRGAFGAEVQGVAQAIADGLAGADPDERMRSAWALMAILSGGVTLARATLDPATGEQIAASIKAAALAVARGAPCAHQVG